MKRVGFWLLVAAASIATLGLVRLGIEAYRDQKPGLSGIARVGFVGAIIASCMGDKPIHSTTDALDRACGCRATDVANHLTNAQWKVISRLDASTRQETLQPLVNAARQRCD